MEVKGTSFPEIIDFQACKSYKKAYNSWISHKKSNCYFYLCETIELSFEKRFLMFPRFSLSFYNFPVSKISAINLTLIY